MSVVLACEIAIRHDGVLSTPPKFPISKKGVCRLHRLSIPMATIY